MNKNMTVVLVLALAAGCATSPREGARPPSASASGVVEQDCTHPVDPYLHLMCGDPEAQRRARLAEEERQARLRQEAAERAERERLERERLAREEAERKAREAEEARLAAERRRLEEEAAERRRLEEEAARKAQEERERREREEQERLARERAEREAREAAERECRRLAEERSEGRAMLETFVARYGQTEEFKGIAAQITEFLNATREPKPCPPA